MANKFVGGSNHEHDDRWGEVDTYTTTHLLAPSRNPYHDVLEFAYQNSIKKGLPDIAAYPSLGKLLSIQARIAGANNVLEVGTLGGYSAIWIASALPENGRVTTIEVNPHHKEVAEENINNARLQHKITVELGSGLEVLPKLVEEVKNGKRQPFDFVFIDADKENNLAYFDLALQAVKPKTPLFVDNVVRKGKLADAEAAKDDTRIAGARTLVEAVGKNEKVEAVVVQTVSEKNYDGFLLAVAK